MYLILTTPVVRTNIRGVLVLESSKTAFISRTGGSTNLATKQADNTMDQTNITHINNNNNNNWLNLLLRSLQDQPVRERITILQNSSKQISLWKLIN